MFVSVNKVIMNLLEETNENLFSLMQSVRGDHRKEVVSFIPVLRHHILNIIQGRRRVKLLSERRN